MTQPKSRRLLFVSPVSPFEVSSGAEQRSHLMLAALRASFEVDVLELREGSAEEVQPATSTDGHRHVRAEVPAHTRIDRRFSAQPKLTDVIEAKLQRSLDDYCLIVGRYLWPLEQLRLAYATPTLVDLDDWRFRVARPAWGQPATTKHWLRKTVARLLAKRALPRMHAAFAVSEADRQEIAKVLPTALLANVSLRATETSSAQPAALRLLFVGSLWYEPNAQGIEWFLCRAWPAIRAAVPGAELRLVGAGPEPLRAAWQAHPGVQAPGFADDLAAEYAGAQAVIAPILSGGGSNIKVVEALAHGRPCVVTRLVQLAFTDELAHGTHWLVGGSAADFAAHCMRLLRRPADALAIGIAGQSVAMRSFSVEQLSETVRQQASRFARRDEVERPALADQAT